MQDPKASTLEELIKGKKLSFDHGLGDDYQFEKIKDIYGELDEQIKNSMKRQ